MDPSRAARRARKKAEKAVRAAETAARTAERAKNDAAGLPRFPPTGREKPGAPWPPPQPGSMDTGQSRKERGMRDEWGGEKKKKGRWGRGSRDRGWGELREETT
jgi:hypothetical protein